MVKKPKQSPKHLLEFNTLLWKYLNDSGHNAAWLSRETGLSKTTITRMLGNTDYRGGYYQPSESSVIAVCLALRLTRAQRWELFYLAFPEHVIYKEAMDNGLSVYETNEKLDEAGLQILAPID